MIDLKVQGILLKHLEKHKMFLNSIQFSYYIQHTMSLSGRICVVTGASKGIGRGIAVQLGSAGATVYITGRSKDKLEECAAEIKSRGGTRNPDFGYLQLCGFIHIFPIFDDFIKVKHSEV